MSVVECMFERRYEMRRCQTMIWMCVLLVAASSAACWGGQSIDPREGPEVVVVVGKGGAAVERGVGNRHAEQGFDGELSVGDSLEKADEHRTRDDRAAYDPPEAASGCSEQGWGRWFVRTVVAVVMFWLVMALAACLLVWWLVGSSAGGIRSLF
jgi:hypothetical protein